MTKKSPLGTIPGENVTVTRGGHPITSHLGTRFVVGAGEDLDLPDDQSPGESDVSASTARTFTTTAVAVGPLVEDAVYDFMIFDATSDATLRTGQVENCWVRAGSAAAAPVLDDQDMIYPFRSLRILRARIRNGEPYYYFQALTGSTLTHRLIVQRRL